MRSPRTVSIATVFALAAALAAPPPAAAATTIAAGSTAAEEKPLAAPTPWAQDRFAISFWVDPMVPASRFDAEYERVAAANFTVLLGGFGATDPEGVTAQIAAAARHGLAAVPSICGGACANLTGAWGFQIADEPNVAAFPKVATLVADAKAAGRLAFVNLLPNYATSPGQTGAATYGEYVRQFVAEVKPNLLSVDHYPDFDQDGTGSNKTKAGYVANLLVLREASLSVTPHIPFWNFFNVMPYGAASQFDISEGDVRWQVFTSLAIGAKGVLYFCYWTPPGGDFTRGQAIMTPAPGSKPDTANQVPSAKYDIARRVNSKLRVLGGWLLNRTSSAVVQASGGPSDTVAVSAAGCGVVSINGSATGPTWSFMIGLFDGNKTALLVNQDSNHPALATLGLAGGVSVGMTEVDGVSGAVGPALDDSPFMPGFQVSLQPGDARLFQFA